MKKSFLITALAFPLFFICSCGGLFDDSNSAIDNADAYSGTLVKASGQVTETYSGDFIEVPADKASITIDGLSSGKSLYMIHTNPSSKLSGANHNHYITGTTGITPYSNGLSAYAEPSALYAQDDSTSTDFSKTCISAALNANLKFPQDLGISRAVSSKPATVSPISRTVGTTKQIFVDTNSNMNSYAQKAATLRAIGTYCNVWVVDSYYSTDSTSSLKGKNKVNTEIAGNIATNFDKIYPMVKEVFGDESDKILYTTTGNTNDPLLPLSSYSDTQNIVNIVIYDIGSDYTSAKDPSTTGIVGYFYAKDYIMGLNSDVYQYSNKGKYFYVDSYYSADSLTMVYSTLAHEFQHMINYGTKTVASGYKISSNAAFNEMMSMLCEDLMKNYLKSCDSDFSDEDSPVSRLPLFNRRYFDIGLEYIDSNSVSTAESYSNNYAFGAWLIRNYGGVALVNEMSTSEKTDIDAIESAADADIEELLKNYSTALILNQSNSGFNVSDTQSDYVSNGYYYPINAINIWNLQTALPDTYKEFVKNGSPSQYYKFDGPAYFNYDAKKSIRPYGIVVNQIGTSTSSSVTINFNTSSIDNAQRTYIYIK